MIPTPVLSAVVEIQSWSIDRLPPTLRFQTSPAPDGEKADQAVPDSFQLEDLIPAAIIFGVGLVLAAIARKAVTKLIESRNEVVARLAGRTAAFVIIVIALTYALNDLGVRVGPLFGALGIGGFALAFAFQDILENFIAGIILQLRQPFGYDDIVSVVDYDGSVTDITMRTVELKSFDGEEIIIPSSMVLKNPIVNWTSLGARRVSISVGADYDSAIGDVRSTIERALESVDVAVSDPAPQGLFKGFGGSAIDFEAYFWIEPGTNQLEALHEAGAALQAAFNEAGIGMPFPTRTLEIVSQPSSNGAQEDRGNGDGGDESDRSPADAGDRRESRSDDREVEEQDGDAHDGDGADGAE